MKFLIRLTVTLTVLFVSATALAARPAIISKVEMQSADSYVEFAFQMDGPVKANRLSARIDDTLLVLTVDDASSSRTWLKSTSENIRRILLHPLRSGEGTALRIRYFESVSTSIRQNIRVRVEGNALIAAIPNSAAVAKIWSAHARSGESQAAQQTASKKEVTESTVDSAKRSTLDNIEDQIAIGPNALEEQVEPMDESSETPVNNDEAEAGVAATERSGTPLLVVAAFLMLGVGFFLFKKMRQMKPATEGGPLIRPIGTHMLGPKQGLLLVDVAGEMVLLGTTDKGVQLLTKLDGDRIQKEEQDLSERAPVSNENPQKVENPFGKMLGQFREASARLRSVGKAPLVSDNATDELSLLADEGGTATYNRRQFRAVTPKSPVPPYETQPSLQERDELIEKLRMLKGA